MIKKKELVLTTKFLCFPIFVCIIILETKYVVYTRMFVCPCVMLVLFPDRYKNYVYNKKTLLIVIIILLYVIIYYYYYF